MAAHQAALLAHLLRCFGEALGPGAQPVRGGQEDSDPTLPADPTEQLERARSDFLRRVVPLTGGRGSGPDLLAVDPPAPDDDTVSAAPAWVVSEETQGAFAERLRRKLGLPLAPDGTPPLLVIEHLLLRPLPEDSGQRVQGGEEPIPFLSDVARPDPWSARVSVVIQAALVPPAPTHPADKEAVAEATRQRDRWLAPISRDPARLSPGWTGSLRRQRPGCVPARPCAVVAPARPP
jgi:hypothetical protein